MRTTTIAFVLLFFMHNLNAQVEVAQLLSNQNSNHQTGYGGFLKLGYAVSKASALNFEAEIIFFPSKPGTGDGMGIIPIKFGYRYILSGNAGGFYIEPQIGYNIYKDIENHPSGNGGNIPEEHPTGAVAAMGIGYLFKGSFRFDVGLHYESEFYSNGNVSVIALRLGHDFCFHRKHFK